MQALNQSMTCHKQLYCPMRTLHPIANVCCIISGTSVHSASPQVMYALNACVAYNACIIRDMSTGNSDLSCHGDNRPVGRGVHMHPFQTEIRFYKQQ